MEYKLVRDHTGFNFIQIDNLLIDEFKGLVRDAFIYNLNLTKDGREYLLECWLLEQTKPDRKKLRGKIKMQLNQ